ncbi:hypothetical protein CHCC14600_1606 [Bacillus licheniformis]|nr:hypothetical protein CHCC14600_1606 [Bacillus licheniformis]
MRGDFPKAESAFIQERLTRISTLIGIQNILMFQSDFPGRGYMNFPVFSAQ